MSRTLLVTGGARSGKSRYAEERALSFPGRPTYIATAEVHDAEMAERVQIHRARRGDDWEFIHAPLDLAQAIAESENGSVRLVDCLTLWASNLLLADEDWQLSLNRLIEIIDAQSSPLIFVTNEVGLGIVPTNDLSRRFRDISGTINQFVARAVDEVQFVISGYPMKVK